MLIKRATSTNEWDDKHYKKMTVLILYNSYLSWNVLEKNK